MIWALRICLGLIVLAYVAWLSLPLVDGLASGLTAVQVWDLLVPTNTPQAQAAAGLMLAMIVVYVAAGVVTAAGLTWAPGLFYLALVGEIGLRLAVAIGLTDPTSPILDIAARGDAALRPLGVLVASTPLCVGALLAIGLCILATGVWRGQKGAALTRVWTQPPVWA